LHQQLPVLLQRPGKQTVSEALRFLDNVKQARTNRPSEVAAHSFHHRRVDLPERIDPGALADAEDFCAELIRRLDANVGPELSG
jgi:hypothetical protein